MCDFIVRAEYFISMDEREVLPWHPLNVHTQQYGVLEMYDMVGGSRSKWSMDEQNQKDIQRDTST